MEPSTHKYRRYLLSVVIPNPEAFLFLKYVLGRWEGDQQYVCVYFNITLAQI